MKKSCAFCMAWGGTEASLLYNVGWDPILDLLDHAETDSEMVPLLSRLI